MHQIFEGLIADGHVTRSFIDNADWIGGTVSAVESWGQSVAQADVKGYYLVSTWFSSASFGTFSLKISNSVCFIDLHNLKTNDTGLLV